MFGFSLRISLEETTLYFVQSIHDMNYLFRAFVGWLHTNVDRGLVPAEREINDMEPIDLTIYRDLFDRFLDEREDQGERYRQFEREQGPIEVLTYFRGN